MNPDKSSFPYLFLLIITITIALSFFAVRVKMTSSVINILMNNKSLAIRTLTDPLSVRCVVWMQSRAGRLGNRMFMLASAYGLARLHSCHLYVPTDIITELKNIFVLDLHPILLSPLAFNSIVNDSSKPMIHMQKDVVCGYVPELTRPNGIPPDHIFELTGFWQSYLHFARHGNELRERIFAGKPSILSKVSRLFVDLYQTQFGFTPTFSTTNHKIFKQQLVELNQSTWIAIHIRRTDFVSVHYSSSENYSISAIDYFTRRFPNARFIVASDDKTYCRNLFAKRSNVFITPGSFSIGEDLITLSLCEHTIITGGTFGWWAAFLANGQVLHDRIYPSGCERREMYYPPWFLIDGKVRAHKNSNYTL